MILHFQNYFAALQFQSLNMFSILFKMQLSLQLKLKILPIFNQTLKKADTNAYNLMLPFDCRKKLSKKVFQCQHQNGSEFNDIKFLHFVNSLNKTFFLNFP